MNYIYIVMISICILIMLTMSVIVKSNTTLTVKSKRWFVVTFIGIALAMGAELSRSILDKNPISSGLYRFITVIEFSITPLLPVPLSMACGIKKPAKYAGIVLLIHALVEVAMLPTGMIFDVSANGVYERGDLYIIYIISYAISLVYLVFSLYHISNRFRNRNLFILILSAVVIFSGIIPSIIDREIKTAFLGMTFMAVILYCYYEDLIRQDLSKQIDDKNEKISNMHTSTIIGIANLIECRDSNTGAHVKNTSNYVRLLAESAKQKGLYSDVITDDFVNLLAIAAPLHDIGKISIPDNILFKPGKLTPEEFDVIKTHSLEGGKMIKSVLEGVSYNDYVEIAYDVATYHHEKWDGTGYPFGLKGDYIPISARIMAICDVYDALIMERVYKPAYSQEKALKIIESEAGKHFDPALVKLFLKLF